MLLSLERGRRLQGVVEVETGESVNHLEALAQWTHLAKLRAAFHLYVPAGMVEVARRLCEDNHVVVNEIWSYHSIGDQVRFTLVHRSRETSPAGQASGRGRLPRPLEPSRKPAPARSREEARAEGSKPARKAPKPKAKAKKPARGPEAKERK